MEISTESLKIITGAKGTLEDVMTSIDTLTVQFEEILEGSYVPYQNIRDSQIKELLDAIEKLVFENPVGDYTDELYPVVRKWLAGL